MPEREVGRVSALWRYPVKSMAAEALKSVAVGWHGLAGDRRWAFIRPGMERSGFPWLTIREVPLLWHYQPYFSDPENVEGSETRVKTPCGQDFEVADPAFALHLGEGIRVIKEYKGLFDVMPLSLLSVQSVASLSGLVGAGLTASRFRPNILIDAPERGDFPEDCWTGAVLRIGSMRMRVDQRDKRCGMINIDPVTNQKDPRVLRAVAKDRNARLGVYGTIVEPGEIAVGAIIYCESPS